MDDARQPKDIVINPVTRIEGHAKITIRLDQKGTVNDVLFHVDEFRGFEKFCEGRLFTEMPVITPRICGICPVSHSIASAKACEMIMQLKPTYTGDLLRRLIHMGQTISSHALSFFHLSSPDMILGWDSDPVKRNVLGLAEKSPELVTRGIRLRKFGQEISERITGKKIHVMGIAPGGVTYPLTAENHRALQAWIPEAMETSRLALGLLKKYFAEHSEEVWSYAKFDSLHMGLVGPNGESELYEGKLRFVDALGNIVADQLDPEKFQDFIAERPVPWSYLKYPYYKPYGYPGGFYRVGPLARLNVASKMKTPEAQKEFVTYKALTNGQANNGTFFYHYARLIETLSCVEQVEQILNDPRILSTDVQAIARRNQAEGIGCSEAPRGTLFHHYTTDEDGKLTRVNLLIATGQNNPAMNRSVLEVAKQYIKGPDVPEGVLNRIEAAIRCYDPCLSCSTHAMGTMPLVLEIFGADGQLLNVVRKNG